MNEIVLKKCPEHVVQLLRWIGATMHQPGAIQPNLIVESWVIIRWYRRNMVRLLTAKKPSLKFDPGEAVAFTRVLNQIELNEPLLLSTSIYLVSLIESKKVPTFQQ